MLCLKLRCRLVSETLLIAGRSGRAVAIRSAIRMSSNGVVERKVKVNGVEINYAKTGSGPHTVLLMPGIMGTIWTDFTPQIEQLDRSKMTVVAWDPPGFGKSEPYRNFPKRMYHRNAHFAHDLMKTIGYEYYSVMGWSAGSVSASILAACYPNEVRRLVLIGAICRLSPSLMEIAKNLMNLNAWSERMKAPLLAVYGEDKFIELWKAAYSTFSDYDHENGGDVCQDCLPRIRSPTLLLHGSKDPMVDLDSMRYINKNIPNSRYKIYEGGLHDVHLQFHEDFNERVTKFLLEEENP